MSSNLLSLSMLCCAGELVCVHCPFVHCRRYRELMLSREQAEPPELRLVITTNPQILFCDKAARHYPECVLFYVRNERGGVGSRDVGSL